MWVLMGNRTKESYKAVFEKIKEILPNFNPKRVHTDFEDGLRNTLRTLFPGIKTIGCHFHWSDTWELNQKHYIFSVNIR